MHTDSFTVNPTRYKGRPAQKRSSWEEACYDLLDRLHISFDRVDHAPAMTIPLCKQAEEVLGTKICKNLFLCNRQKTAYYLLLMSGDKAFKTKYLSAQLGCSRLSFADADDLEAVLGLTPGSATVFGLMQESAADVKLVIDRPLLSEAYFACHPCLNTSTVSFQTSDLLELLLPTLGHSPVFVDLPEVEHD